MQNEAANNREKAHAKLLSYQGRQVLAHLYRDQNDRLNVVLQLWVGATDEQLRVEMSYPSMPDDVIAHLFEDMDDEMLGKTLEHLGVPATIAEIEAAHG